MHTSVNARVIFSLLLVATGCATDYQHEGASQEARASSNVLATPSLERPLGVAAIEFVGGDDRFPSTATALDRRGREVGQLSYAADWFEVDLLDGSPNVRVAATRRGDGVEVFYGGRSLGTLTDETTPDLSRIQRHAHWLSAVASSPEFKTVHLSPRGVSGSTSSLVSHGGARCLSAWSMWLLKFGSACALGTAPIAGPSAIGPGVACVILASPVLIDCAFTYCNDEAAQEEAECEAALEALPERPGIQYSMNGHRTFCGYECLPAIEEFTDDCIGQSLETEALHPGVDCTCPDFNPNAPPTCVDCNVFAAEALTAAQDELEAREHAEDCSIVCLGENCDTTCEVVCTEDALRDTDHYEVCGGFRRFTEPCEESSYPSGCMASWAYGDGFCYRHLSTGAIERGTVFGSTATGTNYPFNPRRPDLCWGDVNNLCDGVEEAVNVDWGCCGML